MFQRDYMMRMIQQMTEALAQVMGMRQRKEHQEALKLIDDLLDRKLRLKSSLVHALSEEDMIRLLTTNGVADTVSLQAIARLLKEEGDILTEQGEETVGHARRVKSLTLNLRLALMGAEPAIADPDEEAEHLVRLLAAYELPVGVKRLLAFWHEERGRYDQAENWLHEWLEDVEGAPEQYTDGVVEEAVEQAAAFYRRLLALPDDRLTAGGLPRHEVESGLADILA